MGKWKNHLQPPPPLSAGDAVGIVAPASPFNREAFDRGVAVLEAMGYRPVFSEGLFSRNGYLAGSDQHRAEQINRFFCDPQIKAIFCARGGFGSLRVLPLIDFEKIRRHPKIFVGFSDITALLSALGKWGRITTFHGPTVTSLADASDETLTSFADALGSGTPIEIRPKGGVALCGGRASGPLAGGNLTTLCHLIGTPFSPEYRGAILLLEDRGEKAYRIDRMLVQMKLAGCFDGLAGLVLGGFDDCGETDDIYRIVSEALSGREIPILAGAAVGHGKTNLTLPLGPPAILETDPLRLSFPAGTATGG